MALYHTQICSGKVRILLNGYPNSPVISLFKTVRVKCQLQKLLHQFENTCYIPHLSFLNKEISLIIIFPLVQTSSVFELNHPGLI